MDDWTQTLGATPLLLIAAAAIAVILVLIIRFKVHAFVTLVIVSIGTAVAAGVLVDEYPAIGVVGIDEAARRGLVYRTRPETHRVEPITGARLAEALRAAAAGSVWGWLVWGLPL